MILVADESIDFGIIRSLRDSGVIVFSISEDSPVIKDTDVLNKAKEKQCLLITEDKDFGELTYRFKHYHYGILLIRLNDLSRYERIENVTEIITNHIDKLYNNFSVLSKNGLRIKTSHRK